MKKLILLSVLAMALMMLVACGGGEKKAAEAPKGYEEVPSPDWYGIAAPDGSGFIWAYGEGEKKMKTMAEEVAKSNARQEAADYVKVRVEGMMKNFMEEVGAGEEATVNALSSRVTRSISEATFTGSQVVKRSVFRTPTGSYNAYVRYQIPADTVDKTMVDAVKNEKELYQRFRASQSFDELDKALEK